MDSRARNDKRMALMLNEASMCGIEVQELSDVITDYFTDRETGSAEAATAETVESDSETESGM